MNNIIRDVSQKKLIISRSIRLSEIDKAYGTGASKALVVAYLINLCELTNFKEDAKLSELQMSSCADAILNRCRGITIPELALMFVKFSSCHYGRFYGQMDIMSIDEWTKSYMFERGETICNIPELFYYFYFRK